jgi:hypothetical protein
VKDEGSSDNVVGDILGLSEQSCQNVEVEAEPILLKPTVRNGRALIRNVFFT